MTITYRTCTADDIDAVLDLWIRGGEHGSTDTSEALTRRMERDQQLFILAWDGDALVGSLIGAWDGWRANMYRLVVAPQYRRQGVATRLVEMVEEELRRLGATRVYALALINTSEAVAFWHHHGYGPNSRIEPLAKNL
ncbi:MAG: GNAT family N-acetyltransferase [Chloroflexi bacterium]|nr:GNAT family N-acetyltransferase [Chloroflexota bacterium]